MTRAGWIDRASNRVYPVELDHRTITFLTTQAMHVWRVSGEVLS